MNKIKPFIVIIGVLAAIASALKFLEPSIQNLIDELMFPPIDEKWTR